MAQSDLAERGHKVVNSGRLFRGLLIERLSIPGRSVVAARKWGSCVPSHHTPEILPPWQNLVRPHSLRYRPGHDSIRKYRYNITRSVRQRYQEAGQAADLANSHQEHLKQ